MGKGISKWLFRLLVVVGVPIMVIVAIVLQALFSVQVTPIERTEPPEYRITKTEKVCPESMEVEKEIEPEELSTDINLVEGESTSPPQFDPEKFDKTKKWAKELFEKGEPFDEFIVLLTHEDRNVRMAAAKALGEFFPFDTPTFEQKQLFWNDVRARELDLKELFCDALVDAVEKGEYTWLPAYISSLKNRDAKTDKLLAWASRNHELPVVREYAMYGVINGSSEELISLVLNERANDLSWVVRKAVLELRFQRWYYGN